MPRADQSQISAVVFRGPPGDPARASATLSGVRLKLDRAKQHLNALAAEIRAPMSNQGYKG